MPEAVLAVNENVAINGLTNCKLIAGDIPKVIKAITAKPDIIILDPPMSRVHPVALNYVLKFNISEIIYVSCNLRTLVKALKVILSRGYVIDKVKIMDLFPHTPHVETIVRIVKK